MFFSCKYNITCKTKTLVYFFSFSICVSLSLYFFLKKSLIHSSLQFQLRNKYFHLLLSADLTLSLLGYLKTRIRWGGGAIWPPSFLMFDVQIWQMIHHLKALLLESAKKFEICKNWIFICKKLSKSDNWKWVKTKI